MAAIPSERQRTWRHEQWVILQASPADMMVRFEEVWRHMYMYQVSWLAAFWWHVE